MTEQTGQKESYQVGDLVATLYEGEVKLLLVIKGETNGVYHYRTVAQEVCTDHDVLSARIQETYKGGRVGELVGRLDHAHQMLILRQRAVASAPLKVEAVIDKLEPSALEPTQQHYTK